MPKPKYYQPIDDRIRGVHEQISEQNHSQYAPGNDVAVHNKDPYVYFPKPAEKVSACGKKNEDEEFVRRHCNDVRAVFLAVKASCESAVQQTGYTAAQHTAFKSLSGRAYHAATVLGQKISLSGYMEAYHQHAAITKEFTALDKTGIAQTTVTAIDDQLKHIGVQLPNLRVHVQAYEAADWTRLRLYRLRHAVSEFRSEVTSHTVGLWNLKTEYATQFENTFKEVVAYTDEIYQGVDAISGECEYYEEVDKLVEVVCTKTIEIRKKFVQLECVIVKYEHETAVQYEQSSYSVSQAKASIESAGRHVAQMLKIAQSIKVYKKDWVAEVKTDFQYIQMAVQEVKYEIDCWAEHQLCTPPYYCAEISNQLYALTSQALQQVGTISATENCCTTIKWLTETIDQIDYKVTEWKEKAKPLESDPNFRYELFDKFWWAIARIRLALCECESSVEPGEETKQLLAHYFDAQQKLKDSIAGINVDLQLPRHCAQPGVAPTVFGGISVQTPKPDWVVPSPAFAEQIHTVLVDSQTLIKSTKEFVTGATRVQTEKIEQALETEVNWIENHVMKQKVHVTDFHERTVRQWTSFNLATQTALAMAKIEVVSVEKQQTIASAYELEGRANKILTIEKQLAAYDSQMKSLLGTQVAYSNYK